VIRHKVKQLYLSCLPIKQNTFQTFSYNCIAVLVYRWVSLTLLYLRETEYPKLQIPNSVRLWCSQPNSIRSIWMLSYRLFPVYHPAFFLRHPSENSLHIPRPVSCLCSVQRSSIHFINQSILVPLEMTEFLVTYYRKFLIYLNILSSSNYLGVVRSGNSLPN
jgi:hypothetical protein